MIVPKDRYVQVGSVNTRYWHAGQGAPVLLLHGLSNSIEDWLLNFYALAENYNVYAVDCLGHGKTDKPLDASYRFADLARFIKDFMDAIHLEKAHIIGHSMGGVLALNLVLGFPNCVDKIVLVDSPGLAKEAVLVLRLMALPGVGELLGALLLQGDFEKYRKFQRQSWPDQERVPDELIELRYQVNRWELVKKTYFKTLRANGNFWGMKESAYAPVVRGLPSIRNPILVVWGREDVLVPVSQADIIVKNAPHARLEIFDGCGHDPMVEDAERFNRSVLAFLQD